MANCILINGGTWNPPDRCSVHRSLGAYRIASELNDNGFTTFVLDYVINFTPEEICRVLEKHLGPDTIWVGFSSTFFWPEKHKHEKFHDQMLDKRSDSTIEEMYYDADYANVKQVIDFIKNNSQAKLIFGGARAQWFTIDNNIDYYVAGNADNVVVELTNFIAGKTDKLTHSESIEIDGQTKTLIDAVHYPEPDVKNISTHWWDFNVLPNEGLPLELARGCIFKCKFCSFPLTGKQKGTYLRDFSQVRDDMIKAWEVHGTDSYMFTDDTFNDDNDKLDELHKLLTSLPFKPKFTTYLRVDLLHKFPHQAQQLVEMGLIGTFLGLETMHPESAKSIGKGLHPNKVKDRLYWLNEQWKERVNIEAGFILGLPHDTLSYFNDLLMWTLEDTNPIQAVHFYPLYLFNRPKDSPLARYASEFSINPEIYGYKFPENIAMWTLPSQKLTYPMCLDIASKFNDLRSPMNKIAGFHMIAALNTGVSLEDIYKLTYEEVQAKYDIESLNRAKMSEYKSLLGL